MKRYRDFVASWVSTRTRLRSRTPPPLLANSIGRSPCYLPLFRLNHVVFLWPRELDAGGAVWPAVARQRERAGAPLGPGCSRPADVPGQQKPDRGAGNDKLRHRKPEGL